jgi:nicotinate phosphoribosyltransferase
LAPAAVSRDVQEAIVKRLQQEPWFVGTSNYDLAVASTAAMGTQAHEWFQAHQQISPDLANSQRAALHGAWDTRINSDRPHRLYYDGCLPARLWSNLLSVIRGYATIPGIRLNGVRKRLPITKTGIDPMSKVLVFSDNLDLAKAVELYRHFNTRVNLSFGIGTRLTCDIPQVKPLNIVIKLVECNGKPVAKLSDSPGKTICHDKAFVRALRKAFDLPDQNQLSA